MRFDRVALTSVPCNSGARGTFSKQKMTATLRPAGVKGHCHYTSFPTNDRFLCEVRGDRRGPDTRSRNGCRLSDPFLSDHPSPGRQLYVKRLPPCPFSVTAIPPARSAARYRQPRPVAWRMKYEY